MPWLRLAEANVVVVFVNFIVYIIKQSQAYAEGGLTKKNLEIVPLGCKVQKT